MAHHMTDLAKKQADIANTRASTLLTAAKIPQVAQQTLHTAAPDAPDGHHDEPADAHAHSTAAAARRCAVNLLLLVVILIELFGFGGGYYGYRRWRMVRRLRRNRACAADLVLLLLFGGGRFW